MIRNNCLKNYKNLKYLFKYLLNYINITIIFKLYILFPMCIELRDKILSVKSTFLNKGLHKNRITKCEVRSGGHLMIYNT